jgi:hypothetical protein
MRNLFSELKSTLLSAFKIISEEENPPVKPPSSESLKEGFEVKDVRVSVLLLATSLLVMTGVAIQVLIGLSFTAFKHQRMNVNPSEETPPADFLEGSSPDKKLTDYRSQMFYQLNTYGWVDREKQIVRIPIEEAMKKMLERGPDEK